MTLNLNMGDPWPFESTRGLTGRPLSSPLWFGLLVAPQTEAKAKGKLERAGVQVQYPTDEVVRHRNGKKHTFIRPYISGIIYAQFDYAPQWDVLKERRIISGVFCNGNNPVPVPDAVVRKIVGLPLEEERLEAERIAALTPDDGEKVKLMGGLLDGFQVDVVRTRQGRVWYRGITDIGTIEGEASVDDILRLAAAG